jgi:PhoPQ-activated pathogenicity-related protein
MVSTPDAVATGKMKRTTLVWLSAMFDQSADVPIPIALRPINVRRFDA